LKIAIAACFSNILVIYEAQGRQKFRFEIEGGKAQLRETNSL